MQRNYPHIFFFILVMLVTAAFTGLIKDFLMSIFWAVVFSILFHKMHQEFSKKLEGRDNLSAALTLLFILLIVIMPILAVGGLMLVESINYYEQIESGNFSIQETWETIRASIPVDEELLERYGIHLDEIRDAIRNTLAQGSQMVAEQALKFTQNILNFIIQFSLMLYVLFFFLRDGKKIIQGLIWSLPIGDDKEWALIHRFESVTRATVKGSLLVAIVQGTMGGLLFWAVGIPGAMVWGVIMVLFSLLPIGSAIVWFPAAVILYFQGDIAKAVIIVAVGSTLIGLADNFLRPRLVGKDTKMPDYLILLSTLGGIAWFGLSGFVIGPLIAALFISVWQMMGREFGELESEPE